FWRIWKRAWWHQSTRPSSWGPWVGTWWSITEAKNSRLKVQINTEEVVQVTVFTTPNSYDTS
ncbi:Hypothetical predicted protein, partial [Mytilus galloprovincialis]